MRPFLVVLLGPDGAGKSTLLDAMPAKAPDWAYTRIEPMAVYDVLNAPRSVHPKHLIWGLPQTSRTMVLGQIVAAMFDRQVAPALAAGQVVVCDSYDIRYRAKEKVIDPRTAPVLDALGGAIRRPDLAIWLDVPLDVAWARKGGRCSRFEGAPVNDEAGFRTLQRKVKRIIFTDLLAGCPVTRLDGQLPADELAVLCVDLIREASGRQ